MTEQVLRATKAVLTIECECGEITDDIEFDGDEIKDSSVHFTCDGCARRIYAYADGDVQFEVEPLNRPGGED